jgi:hypothetical protein
MTGAAPSSPNLPGGTPHPFEVDGRPSPTPRAPPRDALREVYEELLAIERERLAVAVRIERERGFVFPETTVIVRDVRFLAEKVYGPAPSTDRDGSGEAGAALAPPSEGEGDEGRWGARRPPGRAGRR